MKKKISIVLVLAMVLSMFSGFVYAEAPNSTKAMFDVVVGSTLMQKLIKADTTDKVNIATALLALEEKVSMVDNLMDAIDEKAPVLKARLVNNGVDRDVAKKVAAEISSIRENFNVIDFISNGGLSDQISLETVLKENPKTTLGTELERIYNALIVEEDVMVMNNKVNQKLITTEGTPKAKIVLEVAESFIKNLEIQPSGPSHYNVFINNGPIINTIKGITSRYFENVILTDEEADEITEVARALQVKIKAGLEGNTFNSTQKTAIINMLTALQKEVTPPGGGSDGGGGVFIPTPTPGVEAPKVVDGKVELGKAAVEIKTGSNGQSIVTVKEAYMTAAIDALIKAIKEDAKLSPQLTIKLDDVNTLAMEVLISSDSLAKLAQNKINLVIESKTLTYQVPANALEKALKDVPSGSYVEFKSSVVEEAKAKDLIKNNFAKKIAKTIELQLLVKDSKGEVIKTINHFDNKIKISIAIEAKDGNPDLLGVFHINEASGELHFVGGKIKNNKITMTTNHYSKFSVIEFDKSFSDVDNHWSKDYVKSMVAKHVIDGFTDINLYKPEDQLTRGQFAKLIVETLEIDMVASKGEFTDVKASHWAKDYIATAKQLSIVGGYDDGTFKPDQSITRAEMAVMLTNSLGLEKNASSATLNQFKDVDKVPAWAVEYMVPVVGQKLLVGSDGVLNPVGNVTRAEAATIIYRVYNR